MTIRTALALAFLVGVALRCTVTLLPWGAAGAIFHAAAVARRVLEFGLAGLVKAGLVSLLVVEPLRGEVHNVFLRGREVGAQEPGDALSGRELQKLRSLGYVQ